MIAQKIDKTKDKEEGAADTADFLPFCSAAKNCQNYYKNILGSV